MGYCATETGVTETAVCCCIECCPYCHSNLEWVTDEGVSCAYGTILEPSVDKLCPVEAV